MDVNTGIFKAYDIRGLSPDEINEDVAFGVGQAVVMLTKAKTVAVGRDMRDSSTPLFRALTDGIRSLGADVVDVGLVTTPMLYFAVGEFDEHEAGIMITASHNPKEYNGLKMCYGDVMPIGGDSGMSEIRDMVLEGPHEPVEPPGEIRTMDVKERYLNKLFAEVDEGSFKDMKVVADVGNGMEGAVIADIFERIPNCELIGMYMDPDGNFPNHEANPLKVDTLAELQAMVVESGADFGAAFDGDGDRIGLVDEKGEVIPNDLITALVASLEIRNNPGSTVICDIRCSMVVTEEAEAAGGRAEIYRVGHGLIKPYMKKIDAIFGGELAGHYYFKDLNYAESVDLVLLMFMRLISESGKTLSELFAPLRRYHASGEINFKVSDKQSVMDKLEEVYGAKPGAKVNKIDGIRIDFSDDEGKIAWWFNVRPSNTEPLLRLALEAKSREVMEERKKEIVDMINDYS